MSLREMVAKRLGGNEMYQRCEVAAPVLIQGLMNGEKHHEEDVRLVRDNSRDSLVPGGLIATTSNRSSVKTDIDAKEASRLCFAVADHNSDKYAEIKNTLENPRKDDTTKEGRQLLLHLAERAKIDTRFDSGGGGCTQRMPDISKKKKIRSPQARQWERIETVKCKRTERGFVVKRKRGLGCRLVATITHCAKILGRVNEPMCFKMRRSTIEVDVKGDFWEEMAIALLPRVGRYATCDLVARGLKSKSARVRILAYENLTRLTGHESPLRGDPIQLPHLMERLQEREIFDGIMDGTLLRAICAVGEGQKCRGGGGSDFLAMRPTMGTHVRTKKRRRLDIDDKIIIPRDKITTFCRLIEGSTTALDDGSEYKFMPWYEYAADPRVGWGKVQIKGGKVTASERFPLMQCDYDEEFECVVMDPLVRIALPTRGASHMMWDLETVVYAGDLDWRFGGMDEEFARRAKVASPRTQLVDLF